MRIGKKKVESYFEELRRELRPEEVDDLLYGLPVDLLPESSEPGSRLKKEAGEQQSMFIAMINKIIAKKKEERERQVILVGNQLRRV